MKKLFSVFLASVVLLPTFAFALDYSSYDLPSRSAGESMQSYFKIEELSSKLL